MLLHVSNKFVELHVPGLESNNCIKTLQSYMLGVTNLKSSGIEMRPVKYVRYQQTRESKKKKECNKQKEVSMQYYIQYTVNC